MRYLLLQLNKVKVSHLLGLFILILPFSHMFWRGMSVWEAQNRFFQISILTIFGYSLFNKPVQDRIIFNFPLAFLFIWLTFITSQWWYVVLTVNKQYPILTLFPYLSFLFIILFYKLTVDYLTSIHISKILNLFSIAVGIMSFHAILQYFNLDQFYKVYEMVGAKDVVVGVLGNQTHFSLYLAISLPILYYTKTNLSSISIILSWIVIILTGSASGLAVGVVVTVIYNFYFRIRFKHERFLAGIILILSITTIYLRKLDIFSFFDFNGRLEFWKDLLITFKQFPITGAGLGRLQGMLLGRVGTPLQGWGHAHNEFLQIMVEGGIVALILVIGCVIHYILTFKQVEKTELSVCLFTIFIGFIFSSLVSFPGHLAVPAVMGVFSYAGIYCIKGDAK